MEVHLQNTRTAFSRKKLLNSNGSAFTEYTHCIFLIHSANAHNVQATIETALKTSCVSSEKIVLDENYLIAQTVSDKSDENCLSQMKNLSDKAKNYRKLTFSSTVNVTSFSMFPLSYDK